MILICKKLLIEQKGKQYNTSSSKRAIKRPQSKPINEPEDASRKWD